MLTLPRYVHPDPVPELVGWRYDADLTGENGEVIEFNNLTIWIYALDAALTDVTTSPVKQDILNAGRGTLDGDGHLTIRFTPEDSRIIDQSAVIVAPRHRRSYERHLALVQGEYGVGQKLAFEIEWTVVNLAKRL